MPSGLDPRTPGEIEKYLADALKVIQREALYSASVDWDAVHAEARESAAQARSYAGTHRLMHRVLKQAGGDHSHMALSYRLPDAAERAGGVATGTGTTSASGSGATSASGSGSPPLPEGRLIEGAAYLSLPSLSRRSGGPLLARRYAATGSRLVGGLAVSRPRGWIVDLRENTGGSMWPMIAAIAGLLDRGVIGYFLLPDGRSQAWRLKRGYVSLERRPVARVRGRGRGHRRDQAPLAVLVSSRTASAGEAALVALQSQSPTLTVGTATAGMTTGNITHVLPDGTRLMISVSHYADSSGQLISGSIHPDELADPSDEGTALTQALAWIAS